MEHVTRWNNTLQLVREVCDDFDSKWIKRRRVFDTFSLVSVLLNLCAGRSKSYAQALCQFQKNSLVAPAASSLCVARKKLPLAVFAEIRERLLDVWGEVQARESWFGLCPYAVDGSKINLPRTLSKYGFKTTKGTFCPQGLLTTLLRVSDKMVISQNLSASFNERSEAVPFLNDLGRKDVVVYDRGYYSFNLLLEHTQAGVHAVFRLPRGKTDKQIQKAWQSKKDDLIVELNPSSPTQLKARKNFSDYPINKTRLRLVKYQIGNVTYMLATTILDPGISPKDFAGLYHERWKIEEFLKNFKTSIEIEEFRSKSILGIEQELAAGTLLWNLAHHAESLIEPFKKST